MSLRQYLWGDDALQTVCRLLVLEAGAGLPKAESAGQVKAVVCQPGERQAEFLKRIRLSLRKGANFVETAMLCLNVDSGWEVTLRRLALARSIAQWAGPRTRLIIVAPRDNQSLELMVLIGLLRRQLPTLNVSFRRASEPPFCRAPLPTNGVMNPVQRSDVVPDAAHSCESDGSSNTVGTDEDANAGLAA